MQNPFLYVISEIFVVNSSNGYDMKSTPLVSFYLVVLQVEELVSKERELQERLILKHTSVVDSYEKKHSGREIENRVAAHEQKLAALRHEVDDLIEILDELC